MLTSFLILDEGVQDVGKSIDHPGGNRNDGEFALRVVEAPVGGGVRPLAEPLAQPGRQRIADLEGDDADDVPGKADFREVEPVLALAVGDGECLHASGFLSRPALSAGLFSKYATRLRAQSRLSRMRPRMVFSHPWMMPRTLPVRWLWSTAPRFLPNGRPHSAQTPPWKARRASYSPSARPYTFSTLLAWARAACSRLNSR